LGENLLIRKRRRVTSGHHRGRLDIIADILGASSSNVRKTYLMYRCNLSFKQLSYYLKFLLNKNLLTPVDENCVSNTSLFKITDKGKEFLKAYKRLKALMK